MIFWNLFSDVMNWRQADVIFVYLFNTFPLHKEILQLINICTLTGSVYRLRTRKIDNQKLTYARVLLAIRL